MIKRKLFLRLFVLLFGAILSGAAVSMVRGTGYAGQVPEGIRGTERVYECDYRTTSIRTRICFTENGEDYEVSGNLFTFLTDPLKLYDSHGDVVGSADDTYHVISQDDHVITINGGFEVSVEGNYEMFGDSYELYDATGTKSGHAEFNVLGTSGYISDKAGSVVALYEKNYFMNDYTVRIYDNDICSDKALLMMVASYVSDRHWASRQQN